MSVLRRNLAVRGESEVDVTAFLSLMVILVPFLLITAVFSRMTILELEAGASPRAPAPREDPLGLQVLVREQLIEVSYRGRQAPLRFQRTATGEEYRELARLAAELKRKFPRSDTATLLLEPQIPYDRLVQVMDAVRVESRRDGEKLAHVPLFSQIALGETAAPAPGRGGVK